MKKLRPYALLLLALLLASCNNDFGILQSIQEEEKQDKNSVFYKTTVGGMVKLGSSYYARMAGIWKRADSAGSGWSAISGGGLPSSYSCVGIATAGANLYAALLGDGLYSSTDGSAWTKLGDASFAGKNIDAIWTANGLLFLQDHDENGTDAATNSADDIYTLYYLNGAALDPTGAAQTGAPFNGVAFDGTEYWAIAGSALFSGPEGSLAAVAETGMPSGNNLSSIMSSGSTLYVGRADGSLYRRTAINTWNTTIVASDFEITSLLELSLPSPRILVGLGGADGTGYYEAAPDLSSKVQGGDTGALLSDATVYDTTLANKPLTAFFLDGATLFACDASGGLPSGSGLYHNIYDGSTWGGWISE